LNELDKALILYKKVDLPITKIEEKIEPVAGVKPPVPPPGMSCHGCSPDTASIGCYKIIEMMPYRKPGFYWVKEPECMKAPMRVYCDFKTKYIQYYAFLGSKDGVKNAKSLNDILHYCAKIGL
jgi:hypothetical protein